MVDVAVIKAKEDADQNNSDDEVAKIAKEDADKKKAEEHAAKKKAEAKRQEDLTNHLTQPIYMLTQAGVQFMKDNPDLGKNRKVVYIPGLYSETMEVLLYDVCRIVIALCRIENVTYRHNNVTGRVSFESAKGGHQFFNQLGMITQQVEISSKPQLFAVGGNGESPRFLQDVHLALHLLGCHRIPDRWKLESDADGRLPGQG